MLHGRLDIYIHIELNLIRMVGTLVLISIKLFLFLVSYEISVTKKKITFDTEFLEISRTFSNWRVKSTVSYLQFKKPNLSHYIPS